MLAVSISLNGNSDNEEQVKKFEICQLCYRLVCTGATSNREILAKDEAEAYQAVYQEELTEGKDCLAGSVTLIHGINRSDKFE